MNRTRYLGLDIGGANLKAATSDGWYQSIPFPLWRLPHELSNHLGVLLDQAPLHDSVAVTMTGELADCFASKQEGVAFIVDAVESACSKQSLGSNAQGQPAPRYYLTGGAWADAANAKKLWPRAAASNWHAMASFVAQWANGQRPVPLGIMVDLGSTTCDVIPFQEGTVIAAGTSDVTRLFNGELIYTGVNRSPVCAVLADAKLDDHWVPLAAELFATMQDVYVLLQNVPECLEDQATADGRPRTRQHSLQRLARMLCSDVNEVPERFLMQLAEQAKAAQRERLSQGIRQVRSARGEMLQPSDDKTPSPGIWYVCGEGEFLLRELLPDLEPNWPIVSVAQLLGAGVSRCGPAYAVAQLALAREGTP